MKTDRPSGMNAMPRRARRWTGPRSGVPSKTISPFDGRAPAMARIVVLLPAPFAPRQGDDLAPGDLQVEVDHHREVPVADGHPPHVEQRGHGPASRASASSRCVGLAHVGGDDELVPS